MKINVIYNEQNENDFPFCKKNVLKHIQINAEPNDTIED